MSVHLLELLFFAAVAFVIISKLIATLGSTNEEDSTRYKSYFGERNTILKDVTDTGAANDKAQKELVINPELENLIIQDNKDNIIKSLLDIQLKLPSFSPEKFVRGAKSAFKLIIDAAFTQDNKLLDSLIDKRYLEKFNEFVQRYGQTDKTENLNCKISDIYMFGNNAFIKLLFSGKNITVNTVNLEEEWTFTKSLIIADPNWYLTNIEKIS